MRIDQSTSLGIRRELNRTQSLIAKSLERLASGKRINFARDDLAGFAQAQGLDAQIRGFAQISQDLNSARSLIQTADAALSSQLDIAQRIRELAVQGASSLVGESERQSINQELLSLREEFQRLSNEANFAGLNVLDGSNTSIEFLLDQSTVFDLELEESSQSNSFGLEIFSGSIEEGQSTGVPRSGVFGSADFNGDGRDDILNFDSQEITIGLNQGDGQFESLESFSLSGFTRPEILDFNGDGILDLLSDNYYALGNGDGTFQAEIEIEDAGAATTVADINGDGINDIVTSLLTSIGVMLGEGNGQFSSLQTFYDDIGSPGGGQKITLTDINGDGNLDAIRQTFGGTFNGYSTFLGDGTGQFSISQTIEEGSVNATPSVLVDLNDDGLLDIVTSPIATTNFRIYLNDGQGNYSVSQTIDIMAGTSGQQDLRIGDFNKDGRDDIVFLNAGLDTAYMSVYLNQGNGELDLISATLPLTDVGAIAVGDFNGDGVPDLLSSSAEAKIFESNTEFESRLADVNVDDEFSARNLIEIADVAIEKILGRRAALSSDSLRIELAQNNALILSESLAEAKTEIEAADFAIETAELVASQILQQAQVAALSQANSQLQVVLGLLPRI